MRWLKRLLVLAVALYGAAAFYMWHQQRTLLYPRAPAAIPVATQNIPRAEDVTFTTRDGTELRGWRIPPLGSESLTYLYFHGNARGLDRRTERFKLMSADGSGVLAFGYRGYSGSQGEPSETALISDAAELYERLAKEIGEDRVVLVGESLGSGVVTQLALGRKPRAIILDSPFVSVLDRASTLYPWLPVSWLLSDTFRSDRYIGEISRPILIVHGTADVVTPVGDSARLADLAKPGLVTRKVYPGAPHVVPWNLGPDKDVPVFLAGVAP